ncbi:MAG: hypothetical protein V3V08_23520 [Nannocystaceae bacterium]
MVHISVASQRCLPPCLDSINAREPVLVFDVHGEVGSGEEGREHEE